LPAQLQVGGFHLDHVVPRTRGGATASENLAYACPHCNAHKWAHVDGCDSNTGETVALFNPRMQAWVEHFRWSATRDFEIEGITDCGRATIARLQMNHADVVMIRRLLAEAQLRYGYP
jgi:hypothetical protein